MKYLHDLPSPLFNKKTFYKKPSQYNEKNIDQDEEDFD